MCSGKTYDIDSIMYIGNYDFILKTLICPNCVEIIKIIWYNCIQREEIIK